jgi:predicted dehydrogenase
LGPDFWVRVTTAHGTLAKRCVPRRYAWADPTYAAIHPSIVTCSAHLLHALQSGQPAATSGEDNLKTMRLVFAAYESAETDRVIHL